MQLIDPLEKSAVEVDGAVVRGEPRRHLAFDGLQRGGGLGGGEVEEQLRNPAQIAARDVERGHRVLEARRRGVPGDCCDLGAVGPHRVIERGYEMLGRDFVERRQSEGSLPRME